MKKPNKLFERTLLSKAPLPGLSGGAAQERCRHGNFARRQIRRE